MTEERNFCPRCGKRRGGDANYIHTCTPPQPEPQYVAFMDVPYRKWVGFTTEEIFKLQDFAYADDIEFVNHIEALLKEKNT